MHEVLSAYFSDDGTREAHVRKDPHGFYVDLLLDGVVKEKRVLYGHSESYAEDCAENFALGIFDVE
jgi:hypothetical protein